jgi:quercetin dioxygenase-like cupin family protein
MEKLKNLKNLITYSEGGIYSKVILKESNMDVTLFSMGKDTEISEHTAKRSGFVYVIEGEGIFNLEGEDIMMNEGVFIPLLKDQVHSLKAKENTSFLLVLG